MSGRMFGGDGGSSEDEDEDFAGDPVEGNKPSKLGSLFQDGGGGGGGSNPANLQYTAPKQPSIKEHRAQERPRESTPAPSDSGQPKLLFHSPVHAFSLKDGQYVPQGKVGLALLAAPGKKEVKMLLYMSNKQPLAQTLIRGDFETRVQNGNYVLFRDDRGFDWSLAFENTDTTLPFLQWVMAVRSGFLSEHDKTIRVVDVVGGEGDGLSVGDSVEMEYQEFLIEQGPAFSVFNGNLNSGQSLKVKIGKGKVPKGWEEGMVGMRKGGKRLFLLPPDVGLSGHDSSPTFPTDAPIMVLIHVKRVKFSRGTTPPDSARAKQIEEEETPGKAPVEKKTSLESNTSESSVVSTSAADSGVGTGVDAENQNSESSETDRKKADLLSRMAKIGKPTVFRAEASQSGSAQSASMHAERTDSKNSQETSQSLPHLPDFHEEPGSDSRKNSWERQPMQQSGGDSGSVKKTNPLAIVCADLSMSRSGGSITTAASAHPQELQDQASTGLTGIGAQQPGNQPVMPFMYPYPHNPYFGQFYPPGSGIATSSIPAGGMDGGGAPTAPPHHPLPFMYPFPPFAHPGIHPSGIHPSGISAAQGNKDDKEPGGISGKEILEEIQKSQIQLQDALTKLLSQNLAGVKSQMSDICEKLEELKPPGKDSELREKEESHPAEQPTESSRTMEKILDKLDKIHKDIGEVKCSIPSAGSQPVEHEPPLSQITEKLDAIQSEMKAASHSSAENTHNPELTNKLDLMEKEISSLNEEMRRGNEWKDKYEKMKCQALLIKDKYEERITLLQEQLHRAQKDMADRGNGEAKIKKIMSQFYRNASSQFGDAQSYNAEHVKKIMLDVVKATTLQVLRGSEIVDSSDSNQLKIQTEALPTTPQSSPALSPAKSEAVVGNDGDEPQNAEEVRKSPTPESAEENVKSTESVESFYSAEPTPERETGLGAGREPEETADTGLEESVKKDEELGSSQSLDFEDPLEKAE